MIFLCFNKIEMFKMEFMTEAKREGHKSKKDNIQLQGMSLQVANTYL